MQGVGRKTHKRRNGKLCDTSIVVFKESRSIGRVFNIFECGSYEVNIAAEIPEQVFFRVVVSIRFLKSS